MILKDRKRSKPGMAYASDTAIATFVACFSTFLAALLLIGAIVILYKVRSSDWRLGLIATFTCLFAGSVGLLTNARRAELFGATAAYVELVSLMWASAKFVTTGTQLCLLSLLVEI
jgi:hypothetical protein